MRWVALLVAATMGYVFPAHAGPADDLARLAKGFEDAALRVDDDSSKPSDVARWDSEIVMTFVNPTRSSRQASLMSKAVREIAAIAGVAVREVAPTAPDANFVGKFSDSSSGGIGMAGGSSNCFTDATWKFGRMQHVAINVGTRLHFTSDRCVVHEALHGFGFKSHPHGLDSILSYVYNREGLTPTDYLLIETLYDKRLKLGMTRAQAAPIACRILAEKTGVSAAEPVCAQRGSSPQPPLLSVSSEHDKP